MGIKVIMNSNTIKCPNCGEEIDIDALIKAGAKDALQKELAQQKAKYIKEMEQLQKENEDSLKQFEKDKKEEFEKLIEKERKAQQQREEELKNKIIAEQEEANSVLKKELEEKTTKVKELNKIKADFARLEREKEELKDEIIAKAESEFNQKLVEEKQKLQKNAESKYELKIKELEKMLEDQKQLTQQMQQKQEQGSMQLQGEAQELAIEEFLNTQFRLDEIKEIKKGENGADVLQIVKNEFNQSCGTIYYESKRTKSFSDGWISKLRKDLQEKCADIGVIVTSVYPKDMVRMGMKEGIYICSYDEFKALSAILRDVLIQFANIKILQHNQNDKSVRLYNFLTSPEFKYQFETIYNSFASLKESLEKEKSAMNRLWKQREKELNNVLMATSGMYGSIQGIAGNAIQTIEALELPLIEEK